MDFKEPYRATKLWNEVITAFQSGMPLRKHRRKMHTYHDCFMASDAVTWIHCYLLNNPNFDQDVIRQQAINLLGKFLKCHVIESISSKSKKSEFSDNSHLYRFTPVTPQQFKMLPLRLVQSPSFSRNGTNCNKKDSQKSVKVNDKHVPELQKENIPECMFVEKKISLTELGLIWKTATIARLENQLPDIDLNDILDEKSISGHVIKHNVCRISKTGVVSLIDKTDDIPHWVISAMKCLANWPNASGSSSCLPNYPGFEKDVFKVVRDFFINPQVPLLPTYLSTTMLTIFCHLLQDQLKYNYDCNNSLRKELNSFTSKQSPVSSSTVVKTSTPFSDNDKEQKSVSLTENCDGKLLLDDPEVMWDYPSAVYFETDFATSDPVTKVLPSHSSLHADCDYLRGSIESISTISVCSVNHEANILSNNQVFSQSSLRNWNSDSCLPEEMKNQTVSQSLKLCRNSSVEHCNRQIHSMFDYIYMPNSQSMENLNDSVCSSKTVVEEEKTSLCNFGDNQNNISLSSNHKVHSAISCNKSSLLRNCSHVSEDCKIKNNLKQFEDIHFPAELKLSFQLILLFMHPPNRRQLHLLLRVINKILKNNKFIFDVKIPMRNYLIQTFLPAMVQSDVDQNIVYGMVSFLLDNCESLFQPPPNLKEEVEELCKLRNGRQYEEQKVSISTEALKGLLKNIIVNEKLSEKERRRRIKQFKENHPDVYYEMFPGKQDHFRKSKSTFLNRFASLRM